MYTAALLAALTLAAGLAAGAADNGGDGGNGGDDGGDSSGPGGGDGGDDGNGGDSSGPGGGDGDDGRDGDDRDDFDDDGDDDGDERGRDGDDDDGVVVLVDRSGPNRGPDGDDDRDRRGGLGDLDADDDGARIVSSTFNAGNRTLAVVMDVNLRAEGEDDDGLGVASGTTAFTLEGAAQDALPAGGDADIARVRLTLGNVDPGAIPDDEADPVVADDAEVVRVTTGANGTVAVVVDFEVELGDEALGVAAAPATSAAGAGATLTQVALLDQGVEPGEDKAEVRVRLVFVGAG